MNSIKKTVKKKLIETKKVKRNILMEDQIVKNRISILVENRKLNTEEDLNLFVKDFLTEIAYLNSQNFNKELLNENFFKMFDGIFGNLAGGGWQMFWEKIADYFLEQAGLEDGFFKDAIVIWFGQTPFTEMPKMLTDCSYFTKSVVKTIEETLLKRLQEKYVGSGIFMDTFRNALFNYIDNGKLNQVLFDTVKSVFCPILTGMKPKMEDMAKSMQGGALSAVKGITGSSPVPAAT